MATLLLVVIYIAFIGLGIPDSLFGTAWPAIYSDFGTPVFMGSIVSALVSGGTILCSFFFCKNHQAVRYGSGLSYKHRGYGCRAGRLLHFSEYLLYVSGGISLRDRSRSH